MSSQKKRDSNKVKNFLQNNASDLSLQKFGTKHSVICDSNDEK